MSKIEIEWEPQEVKPTANAGETMIAVEYDAQGQSIYECRECLRWEAQVDVIDGTVIVREWHKPDCTLVTEMRLRLARCHDVLRPGYYCTVCGTYNGNEPQD